MEQITAPESQPTAQLEYATEPKAEYIDGPTRLEQLEALKLVKEWSTWMVTVQVAAIAFLGSHIKDDGFDQNDPWWLSVTFCLALGLFVVSSLMAAWILSGIPSMVLRLRTSSEQNIFNMPLFGPPKHLQKQIGDPPFWARRSLWEFSTLQHNAFGAGIVALAGYIIAVYFSRS